MYRYFFPFLFVVATAAIAEDSYSSLGEAFSLRVDQKSLDVGYRAHTAPSLTEFSKRGVRVDRIEVAPKEIRISVGQSYELNRLRVTTFGPDGSIMERVPLSLDLEGPAGILDFDTWRTYGNTLNGVSEGEATIWVVSLAPSSNGEYQKVAVRLIVF